MYDSGSDGIWPTDHHNRRPWLSRDRRPRGQRANGAPKDAEALALAMRRFIAEPSLIASMGMASREIAEAKYDVAKVNESYIHHLVGAE